MKEHDTLNMNIMDFTRSLKKGDRARTVLQTAVLNTNSKDLTVEQFMEKFPYKKLIRIRNYGKVSAGKFINYLKNAGVSENRLLTYRYSDTRIEERMEYEQVRIIVQDILGTLEEELAAIRKSTSKATAELKRIYSLI